MATVDWDQLHRRLRDGDSRPPTDRPLADLTAELTEMLGSPDLHVRDELALTVLTTWIAEGVYDDLLPGLGDGIATGLLIGSGETGTDSVFRRSFSALVLAECIQRDNDQGLVPPGKILEWGDRLATWFLSEGDLRAFVPGKGWADAVSHGADAIGVLAASPHLAAPELGVLLDVLGERATGPADEVWAAGEPDRLALATLQVLHRGLLAPDDVESWLAGLAATVTDSERPSLAAPGAPARHNTTNYLRALYLHVSIGRRPPPGRSDLLLVLIESLRAAQPTFFGRL